MVVTLTPAALVHRFPRVYHMAEPGSFDSLCRTGLLSTSALLDLFEVPVESRAQVEANAGPAPWS
jgi:hypothetical protein